MDRMLELSPYIRLAIDQTLHLPWSLPERIIFDYELVYIKAGAVRITIEDREYIGREGDIFFYRPGVRHSMTNLSQKGLRQPHIHFDLIYERNSPDLKISFHNWDEMDEVDLDKIRPDITANSQMQLPEHIPAVGSVQNKRMRSVERCITD